MRFPPLFPLLYLLLVLPTLSHAKPQQKPPSRNAILLSNVQTLTLRADRPTTARRLPPLPQLTCTGPSRRVCNLYKIETMRCVNDGFDYDEEDVQWTCTAALPPEFKLGSTDVVCEGYRDAEDRWVLKGSCAVEYRLLLTERGEERFGGGGGRLFGLGRKKSSPAVRDWVSWIGNLLFLGFMVVPFGLVFLPAILGCLGLRRGRRDPYYGRRGWGGFFGGGRPGDDDGYGPPPGPPPPYSRYPGSSWFDSGSSSQGWRPGFWSGALSGASLGYGLGRRNQDYDSPFAGRRGTSRRFNDYYDPDEGSSRSSRPRFSTTTTTSGFGSTRRR